MEPGKIFKRIKNINVVSKYAFSIGFLTMISFYITAAFAWLIAPDPSVDYINAMLIHRGCLEAAPASLAACVCAGLLGDLILGKNQGDDE